MTVPIVGELLLHRKPIKGTLADAVHSFTIDLSTLNVSEVVIELIDPGLRLWGSNTLQRGTEVTWNVGGFTRDLVIAVTEIGDLGDVEIVTLRCRPAGVEKLRNARGAWGWVGESPTQWLANECAYWSQQSHAKINFVGQPTMTRAQILRRAEKGQVPESSWDVAGAMAAEEGFWLFENAGTVYFGSPSWFATERAGLTRDQWTWPRPASGKTPLLKVPRCRASDYADKANLQPSTIDVVVPMEYALGLYPSQSIRIEIPGYRGRYLVTRVNIQAGAEQASVTVESPVDPIPHTALVTINSNSVQGNDPTGTGLTDVQVGAYAYNGLIEHGDTPTPEIIARAIAISWRESRFIPTTHNDVSPDDSWGLWQINVHGGIHGEVKTKWEALHHTAIPSWPQALTDPAINGFGFAVISNGGTFWTPWSTFNNNDYLSYLPTATVAAAEVFKLTRNGALVIVPASPLQTPGVFTSGAVERFVQFAVAHIGDKYVMGSVGPHEWDCSGLVRGALASQGLAANCPRLAQDQWGWCLRSKTNISVNAAAQIRGALIFNVDHPSAGSNGGHVVISLGDGLHTVEAKGTAYGVVEGLIPGRFDHAGLVPSLVYPGAVYAVIATTP